MEILIIDRKSASEKGLPRYFTGKPCHKGHISERYTYNSSCIACQREYSREWREANREKVRRSGRRSSRKANGLPEPTRPAPAKCEMCGRGHKRALCLDHDHDTGEFRGWLCMQCNTFLGYLGDQKDIVIDKVTRYFDQ